jgi:hypothetical protein
MIEADRWQAVLRPVEQCQCFLHQPMRQRAAFIVIAEFMVCHCRHLNQKSFIL